MCGRVIDRASYWLPRCDGLNMNTTTTEPNPAAVAPLQYLFRDVRHGSLRTEDARSITITAASFSDAEKHLRARYTNPEQFTYCGTMPVAANA